MSNISKQQLPACMDCSLLLYAYEMLINAPRSVCLYNEVQNFGFPASIVNPV